MNFDAPTLVIVTYRPYKNLAKIFSIRPLYKANYVEEKSEHGQKLTDIDVKIYCSMVHPLIFSRKIRFLKH